MLHRVYELLLGAFELSQQNLSVSHSDAWLFGVALECFGESMHAFGQKKEPRGLFSINNVAEAVRFELTEGFHPRRFSRPVHSTALPSFLRSKTDIVMRL